MCEGTPSHKSASSSKGLLLQLVLCPVSGSRPRTSSHCRCIWAYHCSSVIFLIINNVHFRHCTILTHVWVYLISCAHPSTWNLWISPKLCLIIPVPILIWERLSQLALFINEIDRFDTIEHTNHDSNTRNVAANRGQTKSTASIQNAGSQAALVAHNIGTTSYTTVRYPETTLQSLQPSTS